MTIYADHSLAQKLEHTEARANRAFIEPRTKLSETDAEWIEVAGAYALFDGIYSPLTQTFGLGLFGAITDTELSLIENFFAKHNAPVNHEVSPLVDVSLILSLNARGYQPIEL
jgi:hypothetical protein